MSSDLNIVFAYESDQTPFTEIQKISLTRTVKAQVTLLITDLDDDNFSERSNEIRNLIQIIGESIREHLFYFLLSDIYENWQGNSLKIRLLNQHVHCDTEKAQSIITFCFAFRKFCQLDKVCELNLDHFVGLVDLDPFDKVLLCISLFYNVGDNISQQALDENMYEPKTDAIFLALMLAEKCPLDQVLTDRLQTMFSISSQKDQLEELKLLLHTYKEQQALTEVDISHIVKALVQLFGHESTSFTRILAILMEEQVFPSILDVLPFQLSIGIALEASVKEMFDLEIWLQQKTQDKTFVQDCLDYLIHRASSEANFKQQGLDTNNPLSIKQLETFLKVLSKRTATSQAVQLQNQFLQLYSDFTTVIDGLGTPVSEEEVNIYYVRLYNDKLSVSRMVNIMKQLKASESTRNHQLFMCMVHVLFDEYPFFLKYPEKELAITSVLFGQLIQQDILSDTQLEKAFICILEALSDPTKTKMITFGVKSLSQFEYRLSEFPQFCAKILQIPSFVNSQPRLTSIAKASQKDGYNQSKLDDGIPISCIHLPTLSNSKILETNGPVQFNNPDEKTRNRIYSIIDSLIASNINSKTEELLNLLKPSYYPWFGCYLVSKCISSTLDFQDLCANMLECIDSKLLKIHVLYETFSKMMVLLNYTTTPPNSDDCTLSKNLGSWLGKITLAINRPILDKYIAIKELLLQGYDTQRLTIIIPLVYKFSNLIPDLKGEIEALFKILSVNPKEINPSSILERKLIKSDPSETIANNSIICEKTEVIPRVRNDKQSFANFVKHITINPQIPLNATNSTVREWIARSFMQSLDEIGGPAIEYAAKVSAVTTRDIILKDFIKEQDESKMKRAAHSMVQALSANLVLTSTHQSLEITAAKNLRRTLLALGLNNGLVEQSTLLIAADNSSLLKSTIQTIAIDRATIEIDIILASDFVKRKRHREQWPNQPFIDIANQSQYSNLLPWKLQPSFDGVQPSRLLIYEGFSPPDTFDRSSPYFAGSSSHDSTNIVDQLLEHKHENYTSTFTESVFDEKVKENK
ncbi:hypothetical protein G6F56_004967 [Rhizopus delemar]|nr:hypothetical protein G6F56_004967 [Rhizopus delemar]